MPNLIEGRVDELLGQILNAESFQLSGFVERLEGLSAIVRINSQKVHVGTRCRLHP